VVDRRLLAERVIGDPQALQRLEAIVHPLVRASEEDFLAKARGAGRPLAVIDVPLLFETSAAGRFDVVVAVTVDPEVQRARVLARPEMTEAKLRALLGRQLPDSEKRRRAHFVIDTGSGLAAAAREVHAILRALATG
jgi:dephospho-CoA kinase